MLLCGGGGGGGGGGDGDVFYLVCFLYSENWGDIERLMTLSLCLQNGNYRQGK